MQNAGHSCCTVDTWVLLMWPDVLQTLKGARGNGCGYGDMHQLQKRHHQAAAETPFFKKILVGCFCVVQWDVWLPWPCLGSVV